MKISRIISKGWLLFLPIYFATAGANEVKTVEGYHKKLTYSETYNLRQEKSNRYSESDLIKYSKEIGSFVKKNLGIYILEDDWYSYGDNVFVVFGYSEKSVKEGKVPESAKNDKYGIIDIPLEKLLSSQNIIDGEFRPEVIYNGHRYKTSILGCIRNSLKVSNINYCMVKFKEDKDLSDKSDPPVFKNDLLESYVEELDLSAIYTRTIGEENFQLDNIGGYRERLYLGEDENGQAIYSQEDYYISWRGDIFVTELIKKIKSYNDMVEDNDFHTYGFRGVDLYPGSRGLINPFNEGYTIYPIYKTGWESRTRLLVSRRIHQHYDCEYANRYEPCLDTKYSVFRIVDRYSLYKGSAFFSNEDDFEIDYFFKRGEDGFKLNIDDFFTIAEFAKTLGVEAIAVQDKQYPNLDHLADTPIPYILDEIGSEVPSGAENKKMSVYRNNSTDNRVYILSSNDYLFYGDELNSYDGSSMKDLDMNKIKAILRTMSKFQIDSEVNVTRLDRNLTFKIPYHEVKVSRNRRHFNYDE